MEQLAEALLGIQNHITNAGAKLGAGSVGVGTQQGSPQGSQQGTPSVVASCCTTNVQRIAQWFAHVGRVAEALELYYADQRNREALEHLHAMRGGLREVGQGVAVFSRASDEAQAEAALRGLIRPFNQARDSATALAECCPVPAGAVRVEPPGPPLRPSASPPPG
jgi:hypothetical protein